MDEREWLAERFEEQRAHLKAVAYRMLGSLSEADDAVQETWLRFNRAGASGVENRGGWLTTVVARVCLDMLRSRKSRRRRAFPWHRARMPLWHYTVRSFRTRSPGSAATRSTSRSVSVDGRRFNGATF